MKPIVFRRAAQGAPPQPKRAMPREARIRHWGEAMAVTAAGLLGFFASGFIFALWSVSVDVDDATIQVGDLSVQINDGFDWKVTVWTDSDMVPDGMEYADPLPGTDEHHMIGETASGTVSGDEEGSILLPMGGDWTTLDLTFTGKVTKIGENLQAEIEIEPDKLPAPSQPGVTYTVILSDETGPVITHADSNNDKITVSIPQAVSGELTLTLQISIPGDALGISKQIVDSIPDPLSFAHDNDSLFHVSLRQVRP